MAVILRENGTPARVVSGFSGANYNAYGRYYAVRGKDAHAWVEAFVDGHWRSFDPTPSTSTPRRAATRASTARDLSDALERRWNNSTTTVTGGASPQPSKRTVFIALVTIAIITALLRLARRDQPHHLAARSTSSPLKDLVLAPLTNAEAHAAALYRDLERTLQTKHGIVRPPNVPPERFSRSLLEGGHPLGEEVAQLTRIYLEARFGGRPLTEQEIERFTTDSRAD